MPVSILKREIRRPFPEIVNDPHDAWNMREVLSPRPLMEEPGHSRNSIPRRVEGDVAACSKTSSIEPAVGDLLCLKAHVYVTLIGDEAGDTCSKLEQCQEWPG